MGSPWTTHILRQSQVLLGTWYPQHSVPKTLCLLLYSSLLLPVPEGWTKTGAAEKPSAGTGLQQCPVLTQHASSPRSLLLALNWEEEGRREGGKEEWKEEEKQTKNQVPTTDITNQSL